MSMTVHGPMRPTLPDGKLSSVQKVSFFVGITLNEATRSEFARAQQLAMPHFPNSRWERPEKAHLTLVFLADRRPDEGVLSLVAKRHQGFSLQLKGYGAFREAILWLGIGGELKPLHALQEDLVGALNITEPQKTYTPHVTLARGKRLRASNHFTSPAFEVSEFALFESRDGQYRILNRFSLQPRTGHERQPWHAADP
jgi:2'-5' RNA ligase